MSELETQLLNALPWLCEQHEKQSVALSKLVRRLSMRVNASASQVDSLSEQVLQLNTQVNRLSARVEQLTVLLSAPVAQSNSGP
ncbi:MAG: mobilization protein [Burkholderiaceae bacterium]|nr:mobilization protein [Burkholderiaceae bacterium]